MTQNFIIREISGLRLLRLDNIMYFRAEGSYTRVIGTGGEALVSKHLGFIEKEGLPENFFRIHESYLINFIFLTGYNITTREVILKNGVKLKVSRNKIPEFRKKITQVN